MPDISDITPIPTGATAAQIDAHPIADAVKTSLAAALTGVETSHITITGITIGAASGRRLLRRRLAEASSVHADYTIALPKASAATVKAAAATELANIPAVTIPAAVMTALAGSASAGCFFCSAFVSTCCLLHPLPSIAHRKTAE